MSNKYLILSDIHGNTKNLEILLKEYQDWPLIIAGDITGFIGHDKLADILNGHKQPIIAVRGNNDLETFAQYFDFEYFDKEYQVIKVDKKRWFITHGHIYNPDRLPPEFKDGDVLIFGHYHTPILKDNILNPGSISRPRQPGAEPTYAIYENGGFKLMHLKDLKK